MNLILFSFSLYVSFCLCCSKATIYLPKDVVVPAIIAFGDSLMDTGNNNYINTGLKANFRPYGRDFAGGKPTGRFSNGKISADFFASGLGVKEYLPAYLDHSIDKTELLTGVSFASAGAGYDPLTSKTTAAIPLSTQLKMFKLYLEKLKKDIGEEAAMNIITNTVFIVWASSDDFILNYFFVPTRRLQYDVPTYSNMLVQFAMSFIKEIYALGARRIAIVGGAPIGYVPFSRTMAGGTQRAIVDEYNKATQLLNDNLKPRLELLASNLPQSRIAFADIYNPIIHIIENPDQYGYEVIDKGCCGTGEIELSFLCNKYSGTCHNESTFIFSDSFHPTEKGCGIITSQVLPNVVKDLF